MVYLSDQYSRIRAAKTARIRDSGTCLPSRPSPAGERLGLLRRWSRKAPSLCSGLYEGLYGGFCEGCYASHCEGNASDIPLKSEL